MLQPEPHLPVTPIIADILSLDPIFFTAAKTPSSWLSDSCGHGIPAPAFCF
ncbi:hypothetical protein ACFX2C_016213 [Malus domestica]